MYYFLNNIGIIIALCFAAVSASVVPAFKAESDASVVLSRNTTITPDLSGRKATPVQNNHGGSIDSVLSGPATGDSDAHVLNGCTVPDLEALILSGPPGWVQALANGEVGDGGTTVKDLICGKA